MDPVAALIEHLKKTKRIRKHLRAAIELLLEVHESAEWRADPRCKGWREYCRALPVSKRIRKALVSVRR